MTSLILPEAGDTERLGAALARCIDPPERGPRIVYLHGELGSGKTTLARGLLRALGVTGTVRSPTYTLLESYETTGWRVLHVDLYRLDKAAELEALGLRDELQGGVLVLVEWPERAARHLPPADLKITLSLAPVGRGVQLEGESAAGAAWLEAALAQLHPELKRV